LPVLPNTTITVELQTDKFILKALRRKKQIVLDVSNNIKDSENIVKHFRELKPNTNNVIQL